VKALVKSLMAIALVLVGVLVVLGPGAVVAGTEYPFGVGPWSSTGRYCHDIYEMTHFVKEWNRAGQPPFTTTQQVAWRAFEKTLTRTGPHVPRADFTAWYRTTGHAVKRMESESILINTWWDQNCTEALMEAPASASHLFSGLSAPATFTHYPKNVVDSKVTINMIK
jgi:hypothetical protein